ncbi:hypothetical protein HK102_013387 [Quaeritorhiza haematococci]|nr:hypothetical protein HK102_013387 [Quaeritorhiza haematococci]
MKNFLVASLALTSCIVPNVVSLPSGTDSDARRGREEGLPLVRPNVTRKFSHDPVSLGTIPIKGSAYASVVSFSNSTTKDLFISQFAQVFVTDKVWHIANIDTVKSNPSILNKPPHINGFITWPNEITVGPAAVFGQESVVVAGGWFVPTKRTGGVWYAVRNQDGSFQDWIPVVQKPEWFYHRVLYYDMDGDGQLDPISCRVQKPLLADFGFGKPKAALVYFTRKTGADGKITWTEHEVNSHCDVFFAMVDLNGDGKKEIIAAEFFGRQLSITYSTHPQGLFSDPAYVKVKTIDDTIGSFFDVVYTDVNMDGKMDLLVSTHQEKHEEISGGVYAYELPPNGDFLNGEFKRHTLANGFPVISNFPKEAAPGQAQPFQLFKKNKPWIVVAGDGSWEAHLLRPGSEDPNNWDYTYETLHDCKMTVGGIAVNDIDNDGVPEVFIPCFELGNGRTEVYTFKPTGN